MFVYFSLNTLNNCEINNLRRIFFIHLVSNNLEPIIYKVHKNYKPKKFGMEQDREEEEREKKMGSHLLPFRKILLSAVKR